jgi:hypothetical protein
MALKRKPPPGNVRRVISLGNNFRGVTTNKRGHLVQFESEQEHKVILLLERDPTVTDYVSQPETLHWQDDGGRQRTYTPDFQVWRSDGRIELHEVTIEARRVTRESLQQRETAAHAICRDRSWNYIVHTDQTLPSGYEYTNLDFLAAFRASIYADAESTTWWLEQLTGKESVHPRAVIARRDESKLAAPTLLNALYHLLWHNVIQMDWHQSFIWHGDFHATARVWLPTTVPTEQYQACCSNVGQIQEVQS